MLSQVVTNQIGQQGGSRIERALTSRVHEFLIVNPSSFTNSSTIKDPENYVEELKKVFEVMHVVNNNRVELVSYQLKTVART